MHALLMLCSLVPFYLIGSFPTGHLIARARGVEIGAVGSGNVGATNVARVLGKQAGILTLLGDLSKGLLAVLFASLLSSDPLFPALAAVAVVAGHCFSIPGRLKGGKGVATALGTILFMSTGTAAFALTVFIFVLQVWRMVSLASVSATLTVPAFLMLTGSPDYLSYAFAVIALIITFRHRENLQRIAQGKEPKRERR